MQPRPASAKKIWIVPIALMICALMVMPGASLLAPAAHAGAATSSRSASSGAQPATATPTGTGSDSSFLSSLKVPSASPTLPSLASLPSAKLPSSFSSLPWLGSSSGAIASHGASALALASYPNLALSKDTSAPPSAVVTPEYMSTPAPMGLADYGLGRDGPFSYNTTHFLGTVVLNTPPNDTAPNSQDVIDPQGSHLGLVGSPYEFSLQLNTVLTNVTIPGTSVGVFWTQNVLDINDTAIHFVDDVFNLSTDSGLVIPVHSPATIASGCGLTDLTHMLEVYGGVYQCVGRSIPISAAHDFPLSIQLYNNASVTSAKQDQVQFGYRIVGDGKLLSTGISDSVVFNNPAGPSVAPAHAVAFRVSGYTRAPVQPSPLPRLLQDAEIIFGGPIGGTNAVFRSLNGTVTLQSANGTGAGPWKSIPSAYDFGDDTGETAIGIAGTWSGTTETLHQGPSFLYGLWHGIPSVSVASGGIQFQGSVTPIYGFVFVSNLLNPGPSGTNLSWVPTTAAGTFSTVLPPAIPNGGGNYSTELYAAGYAPESGSNFSSSQKSYTFPAPVTDTTIYAPLYMQGDAQAKALAHAVTGRPTSSARPYIFSDLVVNLPTAFTHLNGYLYPSFVIFQAEGLTSTPVYVSNVSEGWNTLFGENYTSPLVGWFGPLQNFTEGINIFDSAHARVTNETFYGPEAYELPSTPGAGVGGIAFLFGDTDAYAANIVSLYDSYGVANIFSHGTSVRELAAVYGANALSDVASTGTIGWNLSAYYGATAVYALDSHAPTFTWVNATYGADGYVSGIPEPIPAYYALTGSHDAIVREMVAIDDSTAVLDAYSKDDSFGDVTTFYADGVGSGWSNGTTITNVNAMPDSGGWGVVLFGTEDVTVAGSTFDLFACTDCEGAGLTFSNSTTITDTTIYQNYTFFYYEGYTESYLDSFGIEAQVANDLTITGTTIYQGITYCYDDDIEDNYANLYGIVSADSSHVSIGSTTLYQTEAMCSVSYDFDNGISMIGVFALYENDTKITTTTSTQTFSLLDVYEAGSDDASIIAVAERGENGSTIQATNVAENFSINDVYEAYGNNGNFAAAALEYVNDTTLTGTSVAQNFSITDVTDAAGNSGLFFGAIAQGATTTTFTDTSVAQNFTIYDVDDVWSNSGNFYGVVLDGADTAKLTTTSVSQEFSIYAEEDGVWDNFANFTGVFAMDASDFSASSTTVEQSLKVLYADNVYDNEMLFAGVVVSYGQDVTITGLTGGQSGLAYEDDEVYDNYVGFYLTELYEVTGASVHGMTVDQAFVAEKNDNAYSNEVEFYGAYVEDSTDLTLSQTHVSSSSDAGNIEFYGAYVESTPDVTVTTFSVSSTFGTEFYGSSVAGLFVEDGTDVSVVGLTASNDAEGALVDPSSHVTVSDVVASNGSLGVGLEDVTSATVTHVTATNLSLAVVMFGSRYVQVSTVTVSDLSGGVYIVESDQVNVTDVRATDTVSSSVWNLAFLDLWEFPVSAVFTADSDAITVSNVVATNYPAAFIDYDSGYGNEGAGGLAVSDVTATGGDYLAMLNWTENSVFTNMVGTDDDVGFALNYTYNDYLGQDTVTQDAVGVWVYDGEYDSFTALNASNDGRGMVFASGYEYDSEDNYVWSSWFNNETTTGVFVSGGYDNEFWLNTFVDDGSYGVYLWESYDNLVWDNSFVGDNGATDTYNPAHIQAYTSNDDNAFNSCEDIGNYWADWHTYTSAGVLAPYYVGSGDWDYYPIGFLAGQYPVVFSESGLGSGVSWSVTFRGVTETTTNSWLTFGAPAGTYSFTVGAPSGYTATPASGSVAVPVGSPGVVPIGFTADVYATTITESGLPSGTSWSAVVGGVSGTSTSASMTFTMPAAGVYAYSILPVPGYTASTASGTVAVSSTPSTLAVTFSPTLYAVTVTETGLSGEVSWSAVVGGVTGSSSGSSITVELPAGTYSFQIGPVAGFSASPASGSLTVGTAPYTLAVTFTPDTYAATITETGLPAGTSWSAIVDGVTGTSATSTISIPLTAGTYSYTILPVPGYTTDTSSGSLTVSSTPSTLTVAFSPILYTVTLSESGLKAGTSWGVVVDGQLVRGTTASLTLSLPAGLYTYAIVPVANYTVSSSAGTLTVTSLGGTMVFAFTEVKYAVTFSEMGLSTGTSWSVTVAGTVYTTSGSSITVELPNGTASYKFANVTGYTLSSGAGHLSISGAPSGAMVAYSPTSTPSYVGKGTFNTWEAIALGIAVFAVLVALVALLRKPRTPAPSPPTAWQETGGAGEGSAGEGTAAPEGAGRS